MPDLKEFLERKVEEYNRPAFIIDDPVSVPHSFSKKQDIEIAGFFAATFAWGIRTTIINKCRELMGLMDNAPHEFVLNHRAKDLKKLEGFCHRTFNTTDLLYFISFLKHHYKKFDSLEDAFVCNTHPLFAATFARASVEARRGPSPEGIADAPCNSNSLVTGSGHQSKPFGTSRVPKSKLMDDTINPGDAIPSGEGPLSEAKRGWVTEPVASHLNYFYTYFFSLKHIPDRTRKHIAAPMKNSACKRLNMFLRWMVRDDNKGVDFGIWKKITPSQLIVPLDLHVARVAKRFNLISRPNSDWQSALDLTHHLRKFDPSDPAKYDFALFALGVIERF